VLKSLKTWKLFVAAVKPLILSFFSNKLKFSIKCRREKKVRKVKSFPKGLRFRAKIKTLTWHFISWVCLLWKLWKQILSSFQTSKVRDGEFIVVKTFFIRLDVEVENKESIVEKFLCCVVLIYFIIMRFIFDRATSLPFLHLLCSE
jgi:hypothetical protein